MSSQGPSAQEVSFTTARRNESFPDVEDIDPRELWTKRNDVAIIDVRRPDEFTGELGHVPGATLITLDTLPKRMGEIPNDRTVVFVCRSGQRSARAAGYVRQNGAATVYNMAGGMLHWNELALTTETSVAPAKSEA